MCGVVDRWDVKQCGTKGGLVAGAGGVVIVDLNLVIADMSVSHIQGIPDHLCKEAGWNQPPKSCLVWQVWGAAFPKFCHLVVRWLEKGYCSSGQVSRCEWVLLGTVFPGECTGLVCKQVQGGGVRGMSQEPSHPTWG